MPLLPPPPPPPPLPSMFPVHTTNTQISSYSNLFTYDNSRNDTALNNVSLLNFNNNGNHNNSSANINNVCNFNNYVNNFGYGNQNNKNNSHKNSIHHMPHSFAPSALSAVTAMYDTSQLVAPHKSINTNE